MTAGPRVTDDPTALVAAHLDLVPIAVNALLRRVRLPAWVDREDLESAAAIGLCEAAQRYRPDSAATFRTFAWQRVRGAVYDAIKVGTRRDRGLCPLDETPAAKLPKVTPRSADPWQVARLETALTTLEPRMAFVVRLYYWQGMEQKEIGAVVGVSHGRVSQLLKAALASLRAALAKEDAVKAERAAAKTMMERTYAPSRL